MATIQEKLQLKRAPLDKWCVREKLCLASAVFTSGDQNWVTVSRSIKQLCNNSVRPADWYSQKSCAAQYGDLLENADTPKRKKRTSSDSQTPTEAVLKRLTDERVVELKKQISTDQEEYQILEEELKLLQADTASNTQILEMWKKIEAERIQKNIEKKQYEKMLKERDEKKLELERQWKPVAVQKSSPVPVTANRMVDSNEPEDMEIDETITPQLGGVPSTPLLSSLLKQQGPPSVSNPTITSILTRNTTSTSSQPSKSAAAEESNPLEDELKKEIADDDDNPSPLKEDEQLLEDVNGLIPDNIDELAELITKNSSIILEGEEGSILDLEDPEASNSPAENKGKVEELVVKMEEDTPPPTNKDKANDENVEILEIKIEKEQPTTEIISSEESNDSKPEERIKEEPDDDQIKKERPQSVETLNSEKNDDLPLVEIPIDSDDSKIPNVKLELIIGSPPQSDKETSPVVDIPDETAHAPSPQEKKEDVLQTPSITKPVRKLRDRDRSESPLVLDDDDRRRRRYSSTPVNDSHPNSPATSISDERENKAIRKSLLLLCTRIEKSKYSSLFQKSVPEGSADEISKFKRSCLRLLDLPTIRKNVENNQNIKSHAELFRDLYIMCYNMIWFYRKNNTNHQNAVNFLEECREMEKDSKGSENKSTSKGRGSSRKSQRF